MGGFHSESGERVPDKGHGKEGAEKGAGGSRSVSFDKPLSIEMLYEFYKSIVRGEHSSLTNTPVPVRYYLSQVAACRNMGCLRLLEKSYDIDA